MPIEIESPEEKGYSTIKYNLAESSVRDITLDSLNVDLSGILLFYGEHKGMYKLRQAIIEESKVLTPEDVIVTAGAAMALFITSTTLLSAKDHLVVIRPNYGTNIETPRAIGCTISIVDLSFEQGYEIDVAAVAAAIQPNTRLISITNPHNPTGRVYSDETLSALIALAEEHGCHLLVDETYRDLNFQTALKPYAAALSDKVISVSSVSKSFGAPGIRTGWVITRDQKLLHDLLAAREQITLCNSIVDETIALHLLTHKKKLVSAHHKYVRRNFAYLKEWIGRQPYLEWVEPQAGVVCFPRLRAEYKVDVEALYDKLYNEYGTVVGPGHWFEKERTYMRIGYGYPLHEELKTGLDNLEKCIAATLL